MSVPFRLQLNKCSAGAFGRDEWVALGKKLQDEMTRKVLSPRDFVKFSINFHIKVRIYVNRNFSYLNSQDSYFKQYVKNIVLFQQMHLKFFRTVLYVFL